MSLVLSTLLNCYACSSFHHLESKNTKTVFLSTTGCSLNEGVSFTIIICLFQKAMLLPCLTGALELKKQKCWLHKALKRTSLNFLSSSMVIFRKGHPWLLSGNIWGHKLSAFHCRKTTFNRRFLTSDMEGESYWIHSDSLYLSEVILSHFVEKAIRWPMFLWVTFTF